MVVVPPVLELLVVEVPPVLEVLLVELPPVLEVLPPPLLDDVEEDVVPADEANSAA
ncbi:hypothetical protein [Sphingobium mellinum]|uniref:hypothetical protein n=1 Tax=Sphingobium mellinum TaxID=1387166 RepID=UPI0030EF1172